MKSDITACPHCGKRNRVPTAAAGRPRCANCGQWLPWIAEAGDDDFAEAVETSSVPVLVDLWATWCGPCRAVSPALEHLATERAGQMKLLKVEVDKAPAIARQFAVQAVPTLLILRNHQVLRRQSGAAPLAALRAWLDEALPASEAREARA
jgi:thioredoxin 2